jgi:hypothetical protein
MIPLASLDQYSSMPTTKFVIGTFRATKRPCRETKQNLRKKINVFHETKRYSPSVLFFFCVPQKKNRTTLTSITATVVLSLFRYNKQRVDRLFREHLRILRWNSTGMQINQYSH